MKRLLKPSLGFTLVELLVVIAIIGVLSGIALVSFGGAQKQARDSQRKSDLKEVATLLENYANARGERYPNTSGAIVRLSTICATIAGAVSGATCPEDPKNVSNAAYYYEVSTGDGRGIWAISGTPEVSFVLYAKLENSTTPWVVCSNGKSGQTSSRQTFGICPLP